MTGTLIALLVFLGLTVAFGFLSGKVSANQAWPHQVKTAVHVTFITMIVVTLLFLVRVVSRVLDFGGAR